MAAGELDRLNLECQQAIDRLGPNGPFRLKTLLQMVLLELRQEREGREQRD